MWHVAQDVVVVISGRWLALAAGRCVEGIRRRVLALGFGPQLLLSEGRGDVADWRIAMVEDSEGEKVYEVKCRKARRSHCIAFTAPEAGDYTVQLERSRPLFGVSANRSGSSISATIDVFTKDRRVVGPFLTSWGL